MSALTDLFTSIANAIRSKTGSQATIQASDFPTEIENIPSGAAKFEAYTPTSGTDYPSVYRCLKEIYSNFPIGNNTSLMRFLNSSNVVKIGSINTSRVTDFNEAFSNNQKLTTVDLIDTSSGTNFTRFFQNCSALSNIPLFNFSNGQYFTRTFEACKSIVTLPNFNFGSGVNFEACFLSCSKLENVPVLDLHSATSMQYFFSNCIALTSESLNNILASLLTATSYAGTKTLKYIGLSSTQATTCTTLSNWQALSDAGWTTGY